MRGRKPWRRKAFFIAEGKSAVFAFSDKMVKKTKEVLCFPEKSSFAKCCDIIDFFGNISDYYIKNVKISLSCKCICDTMWVFIKEQKNKREREVF